MALKRLNHPRARFAPSQATPGSEASAPQRETNQHRAPASPGASAQHTSRFRVRRQTQPKARLVLAANQTPGTANKVSRTPGMVGAERTRDDRREGLEANGECNEP
ncbi:hypothetical protein ACFQH3_16830 [Haladaptatus sp. GCM10025707]|uniref:hypothetical protein n=1 Tax=Haladaptatus sp. GCM10025707 TaxID=3252658 RepID=UPI00361A238D